MKIFLCALCHENENLKAGKYYIVGLENFEVKFCFEEMLIAHKNGNNPNNWSSIELCRRCLSKIIFNFIPAKNGDIKYRCDVCGSIINDDVGDKLFSEGSPWFESQRIYSKYGKGVYLNIQGNIWKNLKKGSGFWDYFDTCGNCLGKIIETAKEREED